jgi:hypothetical protein
LKTEAVEAEMLTGLAHAKAAAETFAAWGVCSQNHVVLCNQQLAAAWRRPRGVQKLKPTTSPRLKNPAA